MVVEELELFGLTTLSDEDIRHFLSSQRMGVLGLPTERGPYMLPFSYGYDEGDELYLTYLVGPESRKLELTEAAESASFLVYAVNTPYNWTSARLTGSLRSVPADEWGELRDILTDAWQPAVLESAEFAGEVRVYAFEIDEQEGITHQGLPPAFESSEG